MRACLLVAKGGMESFGKVIGNWAARPVRDVTKAELAVAD